ncbi:hypothetical protein B4U80_12873 [Leptotrombidium deliense]|uniref:DNA-directed DNA polymerase n=1 Tax=Leptotrombidium deliense TaxID=299467 RepID=A0A443SIS3_9ACAR|nr:hypothetical protein B4U80_12873 [Leptotrombidium deliense]
MNNSKSSSKRYGTFVKQVDECYKNHGGYIHGPMCNIGKEHQFVTVYDYDSMYASIAAAYNISTETCFVINVDNFHEDLKNMNNCAESSNFYFVYHDNVRRNDCHANRIMQKICKRIATIWYGTMCLCDHMIGADIAQIGRNILRKSIAAFESLTPKMFVVYGDTDSAFVVSTSKAADDVFTAQSNITSNETNTTSKIEELIVRSIFKDDRVDNVFILRKERVYRTLVICNAKRYVALCDSTETVIIKGIKNEKYSSPDVYKLFLKEMLQSFVRFHRKMCKIFEKMLKNIANNSEHYFLLSTNYGILYCKNDKIEFYLPTE